jgi:hypothetical protein
VIAAMGLEETLPPEEVQGSILRHYLFRCHCRNARLLDICRKDEVISVSASA